MLSRLRAVSRPSLDHRLAQEASDLPDGQFAVAVFVVRRLVGPGSRGLVRCDNVVDVNEAVQIPEVVWGGILVAADRDPRTIGPCRRDLRLDDRVPELVFEELVDERKLPEGVN